MKIVEELTSLLTNINKPISIHIDVIGLYNLGINENSNIKSLIDNKLDILNQSLNLAQERGADIFIPTYSYTYGDPSKVYDIENTPSEVGYATEYLRKKNIKKRTIDPMFSYLVFSNNKKYQHFEVKDYDSFGKGSLIDELFKVDGYIASIGNVLRRVTEAHYIENLIGVEYRLNKIFEGTIIDLNNNSYKQELTFFCRNLDYDLVADFSKAVEDLKKENIVKVLKLDNFEIEILSIKELYRYMKKKIYLDRYYFTCTSEEKLKKNRGIL